MANSLQRLLISRSTSGNRSAIFVWLFALLLSSGLNADHRKPKEFSEGIAAFDRQDWAKSAQLMSRAASQQREDGALTRIYGNRFEPYLPLYFRGLALYKQGNCAEAVKQWEQCLQVGAVQQTEKQELLLRYREDCRRRAAAVAGLLSLREAPTGPSDQFLHVQRLQADRP